MIVDKILGNISSVELGRRKADRILLEWYEKDKKLLRKETESGQEIGLRVEHQLQDGDIVYMDDDRVIYIDILPSELIMVKVNTMQMMGRLCFELGNRHLSPSIGSGAVKVLYDDPTFEYLKKSGFEPEKITEKFSDYTVCHGHQHSHEKW